MFNKKNLEQWAGTNPPTLFYPPASEASREVANLTVRKNPQTPIHGVKEFAICLSVTNFDPQLSNLT